MDRRLLTRAFLTSSSNVSDKLVTLNEVIGRCWVDSSLTVLSFILTNSIGELISLQVVSVIAEQFAPLSRRAYVGNLTPPAWTKMGTIGRVAPFPPYAASSHASL